MKRFMKSFDSTKDKYSHLFKIVVILTNFLGKCHFNFTHEIIDDPIDDLIAIVGMGTSNCRSNASLTFVLNPTSIKIPRSLDALDFST
jgi:hypothetical protein